MAAHVGMSQTMVSCIWRAFGLRLERQASVDASAYLVTEAMIRASGSPEYLAQRAQVSTAAAGLHSEKHQNLLNRGEVQAGLRALSSELRTLARPREAPTSALGCPGCGEECLLPIGVWSMCVGICDRTFDDFADGGGPFA